MALPKVAVLKVVRGSQILDIFWRQNWQVFSFLFFFRPNVGCERKESRMIPTCLTQTSNRINATWEGKTRNLALDIKIWDVNQILTNWTISRGGTYTFTICSDFSVINPFISLHVFCASPSLRIITFLPIYARNWGYLSPNSWSPSSVNGACTHSQVLSFFSYLLLLPFAYASTIPSLVTEHNSLIFFPSSVRIGRVVYLIWGQEVKVEVRDRA